MTGEYSAAIIGCGAIAGAHAQAIEGHPGLILAGAVDTDPGARARAEAEWGCATFASVTELLADREVSLACLCTPPGSHREIGEQLLAADVHLLCEKPVATSAVDARSMSEFARRRDRLLAVSSKFRFVDDLAEAGRRLREVVGRPLNYAVSFCAPVAMQDRWNVWPEISGGGVVMDNAPHALDVLRHVLDDPIRRVTAGFTDEGDPAGVERSAEVLFESESGQVGRIALSWTYFGKDLDYLVVNGTEGTLRVSWTGGASRRHGEREWTPFGSGYDKGRAFAGQLDAVVAALGGAEAGAATDSRLSDGVGAVEFVETVYRSAKSGGWETVTGPDGTAGAPR